ncbi:hypothetical protein Sme01_12130 [Sphaerisporangium melleum]|uniref:Uncharacterized protein n=1 Tax=Sphaerisporangium melleum TaxID=321316 RepID=A0A917RGG5_9ACTN|nr:hypothetical protein [Sphaerisporangium melleum]GGL07048.1 hypothetical protein GCM10007964_56650 [Sphaerisporangium melleum]GII68737.1 hypothetical protein Sme01_12130 [Sphaerisporangium melleum]
MPDEKNDEKLSDPQLAAMFALMRESVEIANPDLKERYGVTLDGVNRRKLNELKFVDSRKSGRAFAHILTDSGWKRLGVEIRSGMRRRPGATGTMLYALTGGMGDFMRRTGYPLSEICEPVSVLDAAPERSEAPREAELAPEPRSQATGPASTATEPEARVRAAYAALADKPGTWVGLAKVRTLLADLPRAEVDETLRRMNDLPDVTLVPEANQKTLSEQDREAAVTIGGQNKHLLWIGA